VALKNSGNKPAQQVILMEVTMLGKQRNEGKR
jgi:hypothetical protein